MMRSKNGIYFPDGEEDGVMLAAGDRYQHSKLVAALPYCRQSRMAIDVGAHCGLWTAQLGAYFERVECFEPVAQHIECWKKNAGWKLTCHLHEVALGEKEGTCGMNVVANLSGRTYVNGGGGTKMNRLDDYHFENVDFMKVDCEGYELFVLRGAEQTLLKWKPVCVIEQKPQHGGMARYGIGDTDALRYMESLGAKVRDEIIGDYVMSWDAPQ